MGKQIICKKRIGTEKTYDFYHEGRDLLFQRVVAGIVFPAKGPGFCVVLGEEALLRGTPKLYWLAEVEEVNLGNFVRLCIDLKNDYKVQSFYGNPSESDLVFLSEYNRHAADRSMPIMTVMPLSQSFNNNKISFYINLLKENMRPNNKTVYLSKDSRLQGRIQGMPKMIADIEANDYPACAALAYAVAVLTMNPYYNEESNKPATYRTDYDLFA